MMIDMTGGQKPPYKWRPLLNVISLMLLTLNWVVYEGVLDVFTFINTIQDGPLDLNPFNSPS